jgi:hypothetical protein
VLCKNCGEPIKEFQYGFGKAWAHYSLLVEKDRAKDGAWRFCKLFTAEPKEEVKK